MPKQWVPPFEGKSKPSSSASGAGKPPTVAKQKEGGSSSGSLQGLEQVLGSARSERQVALLSSTTLTGLDAFSPCRAHLLMLPFDW